jgi:CDP-glycerol glycerophosphotransferase (TagB/SpsB family)
MIGLVSRFLADHEPRVVLYSSGTPDTAYQVNMWLATLERLNQPAAVVLREPALLNRLSPTSTPVLCVKYARNLMALDLSGVRVGLFPANVGNNIHLLREPGLMSTFIGHGDSDKNASFNPIAKSYDQVWVAGPAGRERYRRADVGVRDDAVVEVGRPQLDVLRRQQERPDDWVPTVLYAPTWEGWNSEQEYGSLTTIGPLLVQAVLDWPTPVRLIYRPHPSTGLRDPAMRAAHRRIAQLLEAATRERGLEVPPPPVRQAQVRTGDAAQRARDARPGQGPSAVEAEATTARDDAEWLAACPRGAHLVVPPAGPTLFACFDQADLLVADVSSVVTDFLATDRPYVVCNPTGWSTAEFVRTFPSAGAGVVVDRDGDGLRHALAVATGTEPDVHAPARREMADRLLGPARGRATERFAEAVDALAARADDRVARRRVEVTAEAGPETGAEAAPEAGPEAVAPTGLAPAATTLTSDPAAPS